MITLLSLMATPEARLQVNDSLGFLKFLLKVTHLLVLSTVANINTA